MKPRALFLHGGPGLPDYLEPLATELGPVFEPKRYEQSSFDLIDAFVEEALFQLEDEMWIVGHSWGGFLALKVAATAPDRVAGLILLGSLGGVGDCGSARAVRTIVDRAPGPVESFADLWPGYFAGEAPPFPGWVQHPGVSRLFDQLPAAAPGGALLSFACPVLALHGTHDHIPLDAVEETIALMPDAELRVLDGLGHFPWLERPGIIYDEVVDFVAARSS